MVVILGQREQESLKFESLFEWLLSDGMVLGFGSWIWILDSNFSIQSGWLAG